MNWFAELAAIIAALLTPTPAPPPPPSPPPPRPTHHGLYAYADGVVVHVDNGTWADSGDAGIPGWSVPGSMEISIRPETARAFQNKCGRDAHTMAHFIVAHETHHALGGTSEGAANAWAYQFVTPPAQYGSLLNTWRVLRGACL